MKAHAPSRRDFLCSTSFVAVGLATGGSMILAPDYAWALSTSALEKGEEAPVVQYDVTSRIAPLPSSPRLSSSARMTRRK